MARDDKKFSTVPLDWREVCTTTCPIVSAGNVDHELGWTREDYKKIGLSKSLNTVKNDFDVSTWAAPGFLEAAAKELINERWQKVAGDKLPTASVARIG